MGFEWDIVMSVTSEYDADGFLGVSHDGYGNNSGVAPGEAHWPFGSFGRPRHAKQDKQGKPTVGANVLRGWEGSTPHFVFLSDPRATPKLPRLKPGGHGIYADTGKGQLPYAVFDGDNGSFTLYVPYAFSGTLPAKAMAISVDVSSAGQENIQIVHGAGSTVTMLADGSVSIVASDKGSSVTVSPGGQVVLNGNTVINGGATIGSPTGAQPAAIAPALLAYFTQLEKDIGIALAAVGPAGTANGASAAAAFALPSAVSVRAALVAAIPAINTSVF